MATLIKLHRKICRCYAFETARGWRFPTHRGNGPGSTGPTGAVLLVGTALVWYHVGVIVSGQIRSRPHTTFWAPKRWVNSKGNGTPAISGKSRLMKYYNLARLFGQLEAAVVSMTHVFFHS